MESYTGYGESCFLLSVTEAGKTGIIRIVDVGNVRRHEMCSKADIAA